MGPSFSHEIKHNNLFDNNQTPNSKSRHPLNNIVQ